MRKIKENELYNDISEGAIEDIPSILLHLAGKIEDLEFRLSCTDKMPYPPRDENGELLYDANIDGLCVIKDKKE